MSIGANWAEIWGPVWKAVWTQSSAVEPELEAQPQGGSAKRKRKRKRFFFELDGQYFEVDSQAEAEAKLRHALELAREVVAPKATERSAKRIRRGRGADAPAAPTITSSPELRSLVDEYRERIEAVYRQIAIDAELRELLRIKMLEDDEEDSVITLLLH